MAKKIVVGMSGGVDSSVAALLLKEQGYDVIGVTMRMHGETASSEIPAADGSCGSSSAEEDAKTVADQLGIPHLVLDFQKVFREKVMDYFSREYFRGRTPNPCIVCNRYVKWEALLQSARELGADQIATGHYARILQLSNGRLAAANAAASEKDQTYVLYQLTQEQLRHTRMPVGEYSKEKIREMAARAELPVAAKKDSQEICFIPDNDYASFLKKYTGRELPTGNFVTEDGKILGKHKGIIHYTVGQRRGLGLPMGRRVFVREIRPESNEVVIGEGTAVFSDHVQAEDLCFMGIPPMEIGQTGHFLAKIRYGHQAAPCRLTRTAENRMEAVFEKPVRAATPGQALVFYRDGYVAGGGTIC